MRAGVTLVELLLVVVILAIGAMAAAPVLSRIGSGNSSTAGTEELSRLLRAAKRSAVESGQPVSVVIAPGSRQYWIRFVGDSTPVRTGFVGESNEIELIATRERLSFVFDPTGVIHGDSLVVRTSEGEVHIGVERWRGTLSVGT